MLQCEVIGNLGNDAEIKEFGEKKYVSFSVAHSEVSKDQQGNRVEHTTWVSALWYGDGGGLLQYLKKGAKVFIRGRQRVKLYADKNGNAQYSINVNVNEITLCGSTNDSQNTGNGTQAIPMLAAQQAAVKNDNDLPF